MTYIPPSGRFNATISGNTAGAGSLVSSGTLSLAGGNNITLSQNGNAITISGANAPSGSINFSAGTTSGNLASITFSNSNGVSFGLNNGTLTGSVATSYAASNHSHGNPTLNLTNLSGTTASASNGLTLSLSAPQVSSLSATGIISISASDNTISVGAPAVSMGMSNIGNTAGTSGTVSNQLIFAGGNNITLSQSTDSVGNTLTISGPNIPGQTAYSFAGSNGVTFGTNGSTVTASVATDYAASNHSHGNPTLNLTNLSGTTASNSGGLTLSLSAAAPGGGAALSAGTQSAGSGTINFANSNGITFGMSGSSQITASHNGITSQTAQTVGGYVTGNTIGQSSSSTFDARSMSLSALGGASAGFSAGVLQVSAPAVSSLSYTGIIDISTNGSTISIGAPAVSMGMSNIGNTSGTSGTVSNQLIFAGGNNITLSQSTGAGGNTLTISAAAQSAQTANLYVSSNSTQLSSTAGVDLRSLTFQGAGGVSVGVSQGKVLISGGAGGGGGIALANSQTTYTSGTANLVVAGGAMTIASTTGQSYNFSVPATSSISATGALSISTNGSTVSMGVPAQTNQTLGLYAVSNTTQSTSGTMDARTLSFQGAGAASVGISNGSVIISAPNAGAGNVTFSAGTTSGGYASLVFGNSNGVSFGLNGSTITASAVGGGGGGVALYDGANSISSGTARISASGALTASVNGQTLSLNVPAQSYLTGTNGISLSSNGSTIAIQPSALTAYVNALPGSTGTQAFGAAMGSTAAPAMFFPVSLASPVQFNALRVALNMSFATSTISGQQTITHGFGLFSNNANTLSLISSNSLSYGVTNSSISATVSAATATGTAGYSYGTMSAGATNALQSNFGTVGLRAVDLQFGNTMSLAPGMYWLGMYKRESSSGANVGIGMSIAGNVANPINSLGVIGSQFGAMTTNTALRTPYMGLGSYTATTSALPSSAAFSAIAQNLLQVPLMTFIST